MENLGARLVKAGIVSREEVEAAIAKGSEGGGMLAQRLHEAGIQDDAVLGLLVGDGFGPPIDPRMVDLVDPTTLSTLDGVAARALVAMPIEDHGELLVVAMADPSDRDAVLEIERLTGKTVEPVLAPVSLLLRAIEAAYSDMPKTNEPIELTRKRPAEEPVPLVRPKGAPARKTFAKPTAKRPSRPPLSRPSRSRASLSKDPFDFSSAGRRDSWDDMPAPTPARRHQSSVSLEFPAGLALIRAALNRDDVVNAACRAGRGLGRGLVFLTVKRDVMRGWDGEGRGISKDAIRNLWIPTTSESMFSLPVRDAMPYQGPYGLTAADNLYRAAVGSRGASIWVQPIVLRGRVVALLCLDEPFPDVGARLEELAHQVATAFERLIVQRKGD